MKECFRWSAAFSLNVKVSELITVNLKKHDSTTMSHVPFVMKMASNQGKGEDKKISLQVKYEALQKEHTATAKAMKSLESRLDKLTFVVGKGSEGGSD